MEVESLSDLDNDMKKLIYSRMNHLLGTDLSENSTKVLIFELIESSFPSNITIENQQKLSELNYLPWSLHILKYGLHYASFKCIPLPKLPIINIPLIKNQPKISANELEHFERVKLKYDKDNILELKKEAVLESVEDALKNYNHKNNKQYGYWTQFNKIFVNLGRIQNK